MVPNSSQELVDFRGNSSNYFRAPHINKKSNRLNQIDYWEFFFIREWFAHIYDVSKMLVRILMSQSTENSL